MVQLRGRAFTDRGSRGVEGSWFLWFGVQERFRVLSSFRAPFTPSPIPCPLISFVAHAEDGKQYTKTLSNLVDGHGTCGIMGLSLRSSALNVHGI